VDVHLDQLHFTLGGTHDLFQHRGELLARPAPFGPEVHQHRLSFGLLDDVLDERLGGRVLDPGGRSCRRLAALQHRHLVCPSTPPKPDSLSYSIDRSKLPIARRAWPDRVEPEYGGLNGVNGGVCNEETRCRRHSCFGQYEWLVIWVPARFRPAGELFARGIRSGAG